MAKSKYKNIILVGVDFTKFSEEALVYASELAECTKSQLLVLHVIHDPAEAPGFYAQKGKKKKYLTTMEDTANEMMEEFLKKMHKNYPNLKSLKNISSLLVVGIPVARIIEIAKKKQVRMIVVGGRGRTGLSHFLVGSKAERVVQLSPIPVTVVKSSSVK
jgi:nucleotide-binding universal stress UspA family protein